MPLAHTPASQGLTEACEGSPNQLSRNTAPILEMGARWSCLRRGAWSGGRGDGGRRGGRGPQGVRMRPAGVRCLALALVPGFPLRQRGPVAAPPTFTPLPLPLFTKWKRPLLLYIKIPGGIRRRAVLSLSGFLRAPTNIFIRMIVLVTLALHGRLRGPNENVIKRLGPRQCFQGFLLSFLFFSNGSFGIGSVSNRFCTSWKCSFKNVLLIHMLTNCKQYSFETAFLTSTVSFEAIDF